jgi:hypothetical protein
VQHPEPDRRAAAAQHEAAGRGPTAGSGRGAAVQAGRPGRRRPSAGSPVREGRLLALLPAPAPPATPERPCWSWSGEAPSCPSPPPGLARNRGTREELGPPSPQSALAVVDPWALVCQARRGGTAINRGNSSCRTAGWWGGCRSAGLPARSPVGVRSLGGRAASDWQWEATPDGGAKVKILHRGSWMPGARSRPYNVRTMSSIAGSCKVRSTTSTWALTSASTRAAVVSSGLKASRCR